MVYKISTFLILVASAAFAQNSLDINPINSDQRTVKVFPSKSNSKSVRNKHRYDDYYDRKIKEYEDRMKENVKKYKKAARLMKKPQFSDPSYFGHKRKPKKRPPGKRKFCKECEIVH
jgi:ribosomal protein L14E/L6E/L27E